MAKLPVFVIKLVPSSLQSPWRRMIAQWVIWLLRLRMTAVVEMVCDAEPPERGAGERTDAKGEH